MMDPDFAGKLSADVAAGAESEDADTGFEFGVAESAGADSATAFDFGGSEDQLTLLDPASFNPFAEVPKRPFLKMPKQATSPDRPEPDPGAETAPAEGSDEKNSVPKPRRRRNTPRADPFPHRPHRLHQGP